jgi:putative MFS transporter
MFAFSWIDLFIYTVISNIGISGLYGVDNAYVSEYLPPKNRGKWQTAMAMTNVPGYMVPVALMLVVPMVPTLGGLPFGWRFIALIGALPAFLLFWARRTLPESVRFLLSRGKVEEAAKIVEKLEASAGPNYHYDGPPVAPTLKRIGKANPKSLVKKPYIFYTIPLLLGGVGMFATNAPQYYLPTVFMMGLGGMAVGLTTTVLVSELIYASQTVARLSGTIFIDRIGRKWVQIIGLVICGIGMATWAYPWMHRTEVSFLYLVVPPMLALWSNLWYQGYAMSTTELYPVESRGMAYGWVYGPGRLMAAIAPTLMAILISNLSIYFYFFAALQMVVAALTFKLIPETSKSKLEVASQDELLGNIIANK